MSLWRMHISGGVLILAILVIRAILLHRVSKKTFTALWFVAVIRLLIPFSVPVFGNAFPNAERAVVEGISNTPIAELVESASISGQRTNIWSMIWFAGMVCCALYFVMAFLISVKRFQNATPVDNEFTRQWLCDHRLYRTVSIRQSAYLRAPLTYGVIRPVVLVPADTDWQDTERLRYLFAHEYAHIRRFDIVKKNLLMVCLCVHWFHPLVWVMYLLYNRDLELACDEEVLRQEQFQTRKDYALLLIDLQEHGNRGVWGNHFSKNAVEERIVAIMKSKRISPLYQVISVVMVVSALLCFASSAQAKHSPVTTVQGQEALWIWPTESRTISTEFGDRIHPLTGEKMRIDHIYIAGERADAVFASVNGTVSQTGFDGKYGYFVVVTAPDGVQTFYGQLEKTLVAEGDGVKAGAQIGTMGTTGTVTGPCLSFGVLVDGEPVDPMGYFG